MKHFREALRRASSDIETTLGQVVNPETLQGSREPAVVSPNTLDLSGLRESIDRACETIDYLREKNIRLEALLRAILVEDTRYQSASIARRINPNMNAAICDETVAYDKRQDAIEEARKALR